MSFLSEELLKGTDWRRLERSVARLMSHCGWHDVAVVGSKGDMGADVVAVREGCLWVVQVKAVTGGNYIGRSAIDQVIVALSTYEARVAVVATNGEFTKSGFARRNELQRAGYDVRLWNGQFLKGLLHKWPATHHGRNQLRPYQQIVVDRLTARFNDGQRRACFAMATGLGKTVVAAEFTRRLLDIGLRRVLVLCHTQALTLQLESAFWKHLNSSEETSVFFDGTAPKLLQVGVTFGLYQTLLGYLSSVKSQEYDLVIIDEAHHALASGFFACICHLKPRFLLGMTATPWRGDGDVIDRVFGSPISRMSLVDGMASGYLAQVDYRILCDNIQWDSIPKLSKQRLSVRDLNKALFVPQRDEAAIGKIADVMAELECPKVIIFSPSIRHADYIARLLNARGLTAKNISGCDRVLRQKYLMEFATNRLKVILAVDLLNEGVDVPDVNLLVFLRATHSRRIFVQQLGRGLRLSEKKRKVIVLDLVSDIRRIADVLNMDGKVRSGALASEAVYLENGFVRFDDERAGAFIDEWIEDVAELGGENDSPVLAFPDFVQ